LIVGSYCFSRNCNIWESWSMLKILKKIVILKLTQLKENSELEQQLSVIIIFGVFLSITN